MVPQHGCPAAPHPAHLPAVHMPGLVPVVPPVPAVVVPQDVDSATHRSLKQQPLSPHLLPGQQGLPGVPHVWQTPLVEVLLHTRLLPRHAVVELVLVVAVVMQQVSPALLPHRAQTPDEHLVPGALQ